MNPEALELYLKGTFYNNKWTREGFERGIEYFNQARKKNLEMREHMPDSPLPMVGSEFTATLPPTPNKRLPR